VKVALEVIPNPARGRTLTLRGEDRAVIPGRWVLDLVERVSREGAGTPAMMVANPLQPRTVADWMSITSPTYAGIRAYSVAGVAVQRNAGNDYMDAPAYPAVHRTNPTGPTYPDIHGALAAGGAGGPELCRLLRAALKGDAATLGQLTVQHRAAVAVLAASLFGAEPARNPRAMLVNLMYLDLAEHRVQYGGGGSGAKQYSFEAGIARNANQHGWRGTHTTLPPVGKIPMVQGNSVAGSAGPIMPDADRWRAASRPFAKEARHAPALQPAIFRAQVQSRELTVVLNWITAFVAAGMAGSYWALSSNDVGDGRGLRELGRGELALHEQVLGSVLRGRLRTFAPRSFVARQNVSALRRF
jgi:hypothetical protein